MFLPISSVVSRNHRTTSLLVPNLDLASTLIDTATRNRVGRQVPVFLPLFTGSPLENQQEMGPEVKVEQGTQVARYSSQLWLVGWNIHNLGDQPLQILTAQCPHGRFRGDKIELADFPELMPGKTTHLELPVTCNEPPGTVVENAFLLLQAKWRNQLWRILIRLTVTFDEQGAPKGKTEVITTQPVGFSRAMGRVEDTLG